MVVDEQDIHGKENPTPESGVLEPTGVTGSRFHSTDL
jgi:hypothetical protein